MTTLSNLRQEPAGVGYRSGCKVHWRTYSTRDEADAAAVVARHNARVMERLGYDSGMQSPGSVTSVAGGFEVCFL